jgi:hypothetical protein
LFCEHTKPPRLPAHKPLPPKKKEKEKEKEEEEEEEKKKKKKKKKGPRFEELGRSTSKQLTGPLLCAPALYL